MKINRKIVVAIVVIIGAIVWGVNSINSLSYEGKVLNFSVGSGPVNITNLSDESVAVQLVGTGSRSFSIVNSTFETTGSSKRQGSTQLFEFDLPSGVNEFSVARGKNITFVSDTETSLGATVQPLNSGDIQSTFILVMIVIAGALYFISRTTEHQWLNDLRQRQAGSTSPA